MKLVSEHDDYWDTTYFQKTLCLIYSMLKFDIERKNLLALIQRNGAELFINPQDVASILEDTDLLAENFISAFTCTNDAPASFETLVSLSIKSKSSFRNRRRFNRLLLASSDSLKDERLGLFTRSTRAFVGVLPIQFLTTKTPIECSANNTSKSEDNHGFVALYSCNKYLNDRAEAAFNAWFKAMPYLCDLRWQGAKKIYKRGSEQNKNPLLEHIVKLDVADDYENLPLKTITLIQWFLDNTKKTTFKVDDDCFINLDAQFLYQYAL